MNDEAYDPVDGWAKNAERWKQRAEAAEADLRKMTQASQEFRLSWEKTDNALEAAEAKAARLRKALDEIAYGAPWGGPAKDHVRYMRDVADKALAQEQADG